MRTFRVELEVTGDDGGVTRISTEVIVGDDDDVQDAGTAASDALTSFVNGYTRGGAGS